MICATDTNIWIQLHHGEITELIFVLPFQFISTDLVINEITYPDGAELVAGLKSKGLDERELTGNHVAEVAKLTAKHQKKGTSPIDMSALVLAKAMGVLLAAAYLQMNPQVVRRWLRGKKLPGFKVGREWRIDEKDLAALIEEAKAKNK